MTEPPPLPPIPPGVVADVVEALPGRLRRRLDDTVQAARTWVVSRTPDGFTIRVDDQTVVSLPHTVGGADELVCTCLLAPRCLHRAAVASLAPTGSGDADAGRPAAGSATDPAPARSVDVPPVGADEVKAANALWHAGAAILVTGIPGAGAVPQAVLLRAAHQARALGLHRGATAAVRVVAQLRAVHRDDPAFRLAELVADLRELLYVSHRLLLGDPVRGVARREYRQAGTARLYGLCCEPVLTASGYAGVATHLVDRARTFWQVADVVPAGADRAAEQHATPVSVGEARLTYRQLARAGLLVSDLRASADGRISSGRDVRAVAAPGVTWQQAPLTDLWTEPVGDQLRRLDATLDLPVAERPAGHDLLFVEGNIVGATGEGVLVATPGSVLTAVAPHDSPQLPYVDNLRRLAAAVDAPIRLIGRPAGRRRLAVIAAGGAWLPDRYEGHVDLGIDQLQRSDLPAPTAAGSIVVVEPEPAESAPLHLLARRVERAVEGGRAAVSGDPADADRLRAASMPTAAGLLDRIEAACLVSRDAFGRAVTTDTDQLVDAWLAGAVYLAAAHRSAELDHWRAPGI